jgi:hypothetical protein
LGIAAMAAASVYDSTLTPVSDPSLWVQSFPPHQWEGRVKGETGSARNADFTIVTTMAIGAGLLEAEGRSAEFPYDSEAQRGFTLSGARNGDQITFEMVFSLHPYFKSRPFVFDGRLDVEERTISGAWTFVCGADCTCGGSKGAFTMKRVT